MSSLDCLSPLTQESCAHRLRTLRILRGADVPATSPAGEKNMTREEIMTLLESVGAVRTGHFELSSGRHSGTYIQCALVLQHPQHAEKLGSAIAAMFKDHNVSCVVSPALGG